MTTDDQTSPSVQPRAEALAAADWWQARLDREPADRDTFGRNLADVIEEELRAIDARHPETIMWQPGQPHWASSLRTVSNTTCPDKFLTEAARRAGFDLAVTDLPSPMVLWVNPGQVQGAEGFDQPPVPVWSGPASPAPGAAVAP